MLNVVFGVHFVYSEAEGCTFTPPGCHCQWKHELHGPHDGDDVIAAGPRRPPSHALTPAPAPASPPTCVPAPRPSSPFPGPWPGWTPSSAGTQPPSQLPQSPPPSRTPTPDLTAPSNALCFTGKQSAFLRSQRLLVSPKATSK